MRHQWLGPNHRRTLWRTSDAGAERLGVITDLGVGWIALADDLDAAMPGAPPCRIAGCCGGVWRGWR